MVRSEPVIIAVAGPVGSGKTTLTETLSKMMGYLYLPESQAALQYLPDRFQFPERWSFESQIAFIAFRAADIQQALRDGRSMIVDRTIDENIEVFARYYYEVGCSWTILTTGWPASSAGYGRPRSGVPYAVSAPSSSALR